MSETEQMPIPRTGSRVSGLHCECGRSADGPVEVATITEWPTPKSGHDIRVFLGLANFYRRFIKNFSTLSALLTALLKKHRRFQWGAAAQQAFDQLRSTFTSDPILRHFDLN